jgi:hypothetical protein
MNQTPATGQDGSVVKLKFTQNQFKEGAFDFTLTNCIMGNSASENILHGSNNGKITISASPVLTISPDNRDVSSESGSTTFDITSNINWAVSDDADWLSFSPASGNNDAILTATYTENTTTNSRIATITLSGSNLSVSVIVTQDYFTSIQETTLSKQSKVYPNPTKDKLYIEFTNNHNEIIKMSLLNILGRILFVKEGNELNAKIIEIDFSKYSTGIYYLNLYTKEGIIRKKVSVIR